MATAKPAGSMWRISRLTIALIVGAALLLGYWLYGAPMTRTAEAGVGYAAKGACSCRYVADRSLSSCKGDFVDGMALVMLSEDEEAQSVTARIPLIASDTATFSKGAGCQLQSLRD